MEQTATLHPAIILTIIIGYFVALVIVSYFTARNSDNQTFFLADRQSPWYVVAFGMVGGSLSGVTFISVPGWVGSGQFAYMQMVLGYLLGYYVIGWILIPLYYRANLTSIYTYLDTRFGTTAYRTGSAFFMLSRTIGSGFRMYIVIMVLQKFVFDAANIPFWVSSLMIIVFILIYTYKAGIKTIVWTDTLQTICLLSALFYTIYFVGNQMNLNASGIITAVKNSPYSQIFFFDGGWSDPNNFFKQFLSGAFIAIVMTGLDQDMMQKNLTCKNIGEAQKNIAWYSTTLVFVNLLFLSLGALLYLYCSQHGIELPTKTVNGITKTDSDMLFPTLAMYHFPMAIAILFVLGMVASAYSSVDSALTALTTTFCMDFLDFDKLQWDEQRKIRTRVTVHIGFALLMLLVIVIFGFVKNEAVIKAVFDVAGYTYGPLLGLFAFGFYTRYKIHDRWSVWVCLAAPILTYFLDKYSVTLFFGYKFGFEKLIINGLLTFIGLWLIAKRKK